MTLAERDDLAVIMPVFKVEQYLSTCLDSLLQQNFEGSYRIILVNDCSPDKSHEICTQYANQFSDKITYIAHESNQGTAVARNTGLNAVNADFFVFVDPDDILPENALRTLYDEIKQSDSDIVKGNNTILKGRLNQPANYNVKNKLSFHHEDCLTTLLLHRNVRGHPWGKIFRHSTLGHIRFTPGYRMAQDLLYCIEVFSKCRKLTLIPTNVYHYRLHDRGATGRKYQTNAYQWWFKAVDNAKQFTHCRHHKSAHFSLKVRTLLQAIKEIRDLEHSSRNTLFDNIENQRKCWEISLKSFALNQHFSPRSLIHYLKYCGVRKILDKDSRLSRVLVK